MPVPIKTMMKQYIFITILIYLAFLFEFVLYNAFGSWGKPEFMVLSIIFCNLYWGIRHSLWAAFVAGMLKGSFDIEPFFTYVFIFISAAYLTTFLRRHVYQPGSRFSRVVVTFLVLLSIFIIETLLHLRYTQVRILDALVYIFCPPMMLTMIVASFVFVNLRNVVVKLKM